MRRPDGARAGRRAGLRALVVLLAAATPLAAVRGQDAAVTPPASPAAQPATVPGWPDGVVPRAPRNFRVTVYARGLAGPRSLLVLPNGDVLVTEERPAAARVTLLRDGRGDGVADQQFVLLAGLDQPHGLALRRDRLYVASGDAVLSCPYLVGQTRMHGECRRLLELGADDSRARGPHALAISPDEGRLYVGVGSGAGAGAILVARPDGRELRRYARSVGEPTGLAFEPHSGALWSTLSGGEGQADVAGDAAGDGPTGGPGSFAATDALWSVREDAAHGGAARAPELRFAAPAATLGLAFYGREHFPALYRGGAFVAQHGVRHGTELAGYKVVFVPFAAGRPAGAAEDFLTGFVREAGQGEVYGRPAAVAVASDGTLLVADDVGGTIWRVTFKCAACTPDPRPASPQRPRAARRPAA